MKGKLPVIAALLLFLGGCGMVFYGNYQCRALDASVREKEAELKSIRAEIAGAEKQVTESEVEMVKNNVSSLGAEIAAAQNSLGEMKDGDGRQAVFDKMKGYFSDTLLQIQWYPTDLAGKAQWVFESTFDFTVDDIPVIWTLTRPGDGTLLAYVAGTYRVSEDSFRNMELRKTYAGVEAMAPEPEVEPETTEGAEEKEEEPAPPPSSNDMSVPAQNPEDPSVKWDEEPQDKEADTGAVVSDDGTVVTGYVVNEEGGGE